MDDFFKYMTKSTEDKSWGLYLNVAGCASIGEGESYPPGGHPAGYTFNWKNGRILHEFQVNYITHGGGIIETKQGSFSVDEGSVIIIRPGVWHRYQPNIKTGWKEHYVGFNGTFAKEIFEQKFFLNPDENIIHIGYQENVIKILYDIFENVKNERIGYQQVCSGLIIHLLALIVSIRKNDDFSRKDIEKIIRKSRLIIRDRINENLDMQELAAELDIGYSLFRKMFKKYTGISPAQYHLSLRVQEARNLLLNSDMSVKEIAYELGFNSIYYFSRIFKSKTNKTPSEYRIKILKEMPEKR